MRHSCLFAAFPLTAVVLAGCGPDSSGGDNYVNPATDVDLPLETFRLADTEGLDSTLQYTIFRDFYRGLQPAQEGEDEGVATALREHLNPFLGATPNAAGDDYTSVRNPLDLINNVIRLGTVDNFNEGRQLMVESISDGAPTKYNTAANDALIRFTEAAGDETIPTADRTWIYPALDWTSTPDIGKIFRSVQYVARSAAEGDDTQAEIASASWSGRFDNGQFGTSGFNQPEFAATSLSGRTRGTVELLQEFVGTQRDSLTLSNATGLTIGGQAYDCIRVTISYSDREVRVFLSDDQPSTVSEGGEINPNPQNCGNQQNGDEAIRYGSITIPGRQ